MKSHKRNPQQLLVRAGLLVLLSTTAACTALSSITNVFSQGAEDATVPAALQDFSPSLKVEKVWSTKLGLRFMQRALQVN